MIRCPIVTGAGRPRRRSGPLSPRRAEAAGRAGPRGWTTARRAASPAARPRGRGPRSGAAPALARAGRPGRRPSPLVAAGTGERLLLQPPALLARVGQLAEGVGVLPPADDQ